MQLLTDELRGHLPPLYAQEDTPDPIVYAHFFCLANGWDWFAYEGSPTDADGYYDTSAPKVDFLFFGLVNGFEAELGYFSLSELENTGLVERDRHWQPRRLSEIRAELGR